MVFCP